MSVLETFILCALIAIANILVIISSAASKAHSQFKGRKEFIIFASSLITILLIEIFSYTTLHISIDDYGDIALLSRISNALYYICSLVPTLIYSFYIFKVVDKKANVFDYILLILPLIVISTTSIISIFTPCLFKVDENNVLTFGPYYPLFIVSIVFYFIYNEVILIVNRKHIDKKMFFAYCFSLTAPIIGIGLYFLLVLINRPTIDNVWITASVMLSIQYFSFIQTKISYTDSLTSLSNKERLVVELNKQFNSKKRKDIYGFMLDLDNFKSINDNYGHEVGDLALIKASKMLINVAPKNSLVTRYAGDEFIVLVESNDENLPNEFQEKLKEAEREFNSSEDGKLYSLTFSVGYAFFSKNEILDPTSFLRTIDQRMYVSKKHKESTYGIKTTRDGKIDQDLLKEFGINYSEGLNRFKGNYKLYNDCLNKFLSKDRFSDLSKSIKEDELVKLLYKLYILYDDASNLALTTLASIVLKLIHTIQDNNERDEDFIYSSNELISTYSKLIDALK